MSHYKAPLRDMQFVSHELLDMPSHYASLPGYEDVTVDVMDAIIEEGRKFSEEVLAPINHSADEEGCHLKDGNVTTPKGYPEAYKQYVEGGWPGLNGDPEFGGQGLPGSLSIMINEMTGACNWAWTMYPGLSNAAIQCIGKHGTVEQKDIYMEKLITGTWTGSMCLTEAHCGSDVGLLRTKAVKQADGSYTLTGSKIFISGADHDMAENIVHMVLARVEGAPEGTAGISLFIVPKFIPDAKGNVGKRNAANVSSLEKKMGLKGSATCVLNFDGATGFIVGAENSGLKQMFTMMNVARVGTALQGLAMAEPAYQAALNYAKERLAMRSLTGAKNPAGAADPIIVHPDVRRMLMTQKAFTEGYRAFLYWLIQKADVVAKGDEAAAKEADDLMAFLTPIAKGFVTETGFECTNLALQCFGGHGYIKEHGVEQLVRDCRISTVYEGTTGIQALDLIGRKVLGSGGELLKKFTKLVHKLCEASKNDAQLSGLATVLAEKNKEWGALTMDVGGKAMENADEVGAASVDYLMYSGYVVLGYFWLLMAHKASEQLASGNGDADFYKAKLATAQFYFDRLLPRTLMHAAAMRSGSANLMALDADHFAF
ncbi:MAG TPA: acyl-CoA dehydrogenase C-terminal domain-containing protein [Pseudomonadales bacterium]